MKIKQSNQSTVERNILIGMIVHSKVLGVISAKWTKEGLFQSRISNVVGNWTVKFYHKYGKAPKKSIESIFQNWSETADLDEVKLVETLLSSLSDQYDQIKKDINADYLLDQANQYFNQVAIQKLKDSLEGALENGSVEEAITKVNTFNKIEIGGESIVDVVNDFSVMESVFVEKSEPIIKFNSGLGAFFGNTLERDGFVAFMAPEKRGKTHWLLTLAWRAMQQRRRVLFFEVGDLSMRQILMRFYVRAANRPQWPKTIEYPIQMIKSEIGWDVETETRSWNTSLSINEGKEAMQRVIDTKIKSKESFLKLSVHPNNSINATGIRSVVQNLCREGWVPDVVVLDYADLLSPAPGFSESRDAVNANWKELRRLSQEIHGLVITATQANAQSYKADELSTEHFSEDKRKLAHVTAMIGINQTVMEKKNGLMRLNYLVRREDEFSRDKFCYVAGNLALCNPAILSKFE